jgi:hypothetical protein
VQSPPLPARENVEHAIGTLHHQSVAKILSKLYTPEQVVLDLIAAQNALYAVAPIVDGNLAVTAK